MAALRSYEGSHIQRMSRKSCSKASFVLILNGGVLQMSQYDTLYWDETNVFCSSEEFRRNTLWLPIRLLTQVDVQAGTHGEGCDFLSRFDEGQLK